MLLRFIQTSSALLIITLVITASNSLQVKASNPACASSDYASGKVEKIIKNKEIILSNGVQLILANVKPAANLKPGLLNDLLKGKLIKYYFSGRKKDRYNRMITQLVLDDQKEIWVQLWMIKNGYARAYTLPHNEDCFQELLIAEHLAREANKGEWDRGKSFKIISSSNLIILNNLPQGSFQIVSGKLHKISRSGSNTFLNFAKDWKKDFTAIISNHLLKRKNSQWPELKSMIGKTITVRGWIDFWKGPMIRLHSPKMLEQLEAPADKENKKTPR